MRYVFYKVLSAQGNNAFEETEPSYIVGIGDINYFDTGGKVAGLE